MVSFEESCRVFYMVKGHLDATEDTIRSSYDSYLRRLWGNIECYQAEHGFKECFDRRCRSHKKRPHFVEAFKVVSKI